MPLIHNPKQSANVSASIDAWEVFKADNAISITAGRTTFTYDELYRAFYAGFDASQEHHAPKLFA